MNRNVLKIIALLAMFVDHIGWQFFPEIIWFRAIGRLTFPIFAFFIAQGMFYTRNRKKYILTMFIVGIVSQLPYMFLSSSFYNLNVMFTFILSSLLIWVLEKVKNKEEKQSLNIFYLVSLVSVVVALSLLGVLNYGIFGVLLVLIFYFMKDNKFLMYSFAALSLVALTAQKWIIGGGRSAPPCKYLVYCHWCF